jgi:hypothetical protein
MLARFLPSLTRRGQHDSQSHDSQSHDSQSHLGRVQVKDLLRAAQYLWQKASMMLETLIQQETIDERRDRLRTVVNDMEHGLKGAIDYRVIDCQAIDYHAIDCHAIDCHAIDYQARTTG